MAGRDRAGLPADHRGRGSTDQARVLDPAHLHTTSHIRVEIMEAFRDAMIAGMSTGDPQTGREVLNAVAALQPVRIDDDDFRSAMSALAQRRFDQVMPYISGLEAAGILRRRGTSLRIVPDLLGDAILTGASVDTVSGVPVGYLEQVYQAADGTALGNVFINGSRVDWQIQQGNRGHASLVQPLWELLIAQFAQAGIHGRVALLQLLKKVAAFQPGPTLALIRWALANPTQECEPSDHPLARLYVLGLRRRPPRACPAAGEHRLQLRSSGRDDRPAVATCRDRSAPAEPVSPPSDPRPGTSDQLRAHHAVALPRGTTGHRRSLVRSP